MKAIVLSQQAERVGVWISFVKNAELHPTKNTENTAMRNKKENVLFARINFFLNVI